MTEAVPSQRVTLLVVEDEYLIALALEDSLDAAGFSVMLASNETKRSRALTNT